MVDGLLSIPVLLEMMHPTRDYSKSLRIRDSGSDHQIIFIRFRVVYMHDAWYIHSSSSVYPIGSQGQQLRQGAQDLIHAAACVDEEGNPSGGFLCTCRPEWRYNLSTWSWTFPEVFSWLEQARKTSLKSHPWGILTRCLNHLNRLISKSSKSLPDDLASHPSSKSHPVEETDSALTFLFWSLPITQKHKFQLISSYIIPPIVNKTPKLSNSFAWGKDILPYGHGTWI